MSIEIAGSRDDRGYTGTYVIATSYGAMTNDYAVDIGDGIELASIEDTYLYPGLSCAWAFIFIRCSGALATQQADSKTKNY